jgi:hypothetical protein
MIGWESIVLYVNYFSCWVFCVLFISFYIARLGWSNKPAEPEDANTFRAYGLFCFWGMILGWFGIIALYLVYKNTDSDSI